MSVVPFRTPLAQQYGTVGALSLALHPGCPFKHEYVRDKFNGLCNKGKGAVLNLVLKIEGDQVDLRKISKILLIHPGLLSQFMLLDNGKELEAYKDTMAENFNRILTIMTDEVGEILDE